MLTIIKKFTYDKGSFFLSGYFAFSILVIDYIVIYLIHNSVTGYMLQAPLQRYDQINELYEMT